MEIRFTVGYFPFYIKDYMILSLYTHIINIRHAYPAITWQVSLHILSRVYLSNLQTYIYIYMLLLYSELWPPSYSAQEPLNFVFWEWPAQTYGGLRTERDVQVMKTHTELSAMWGAREKTISGAILGLAKRSSGLPAGLCPNPPGSKERQEVQCSPRQLGCTPASGEAQVSQHWDI